MPALRTEKRPLRQLTLTGKPASVTSSSKSASSKSKKTAVDRVYTDTVLTIKPCFAELIEKREKNHEFRKYRLRSTVERLWLYETAPVSAITYVVVTARPKTPGEIHDSSGVGNDDFDNGLKLSKFGYPVLGLYKLKRGINASEMKTRFEIAPPQGYFYAPKKMVEELKLEDMEKLF